MRRSLTDRDTSKMTPVGPLMANGVPVLRKQEPSTYSGDVALSTSTEDQFAADLSEARAKLEDKSGKFFGSAPVVPIGYQPTVENLRQTEERIRLLYGQARMEALDEQYKKAKETK